MPPICEVIIVHKVVSLAVKRFHLNGGQVLLEECTAAYARINVYGVMVCAVCGVCSCLRTSSV